MKGLFKLISIFILFFILTVNSFAIEPANNFKIGSIEETSVNFEWDIVQDASFYVISYGKISGEVDGYEMQTDFIKTNDFKIENLEIGTTYYFAVTAYDEGANESILSNELTVDIEDPSSTVDTTFSLEGIKMISSAEIELTFSNPLDDTEGTEREFNIYNKSDKIDSFDLLSIDLNKNDKTKLNLSLDSELQIGIEYEIVVIAIKNEALDNIESGIDSIEVFFYNGEVKEEPIELKAALPENAGPSGVDIKGVKKTTVTVAEDTSKLPKTGPEHVLIFILSIVLGAVIFVFKYKKA